MSEGSPDTYKVRKIGDDGSYESEIELKATELHECVVAMAAFFEDFYQGDIALKAKFRGLLSEAFAEMVGETLRIAKESAE